MYHGEDASLQLVDNWRRIVIVTMPDSADVTHIRSEVGDAKRTSELGNNDQPTARTMQTPNGSQRILVQLTLLDWLEAAPSPWGRRCHFKRVHHETSPPVRL
jgi:hypothetical protein